MPGYTVCEAVLGFYTGQHEQAGRKVGIGRSTSYACLLRQLEHILQEVLHEHDTMTGLPKQNGLSCETLASAVVMQICCYAQNHPGRFKGDA